jgi:hypothetical protein
VGREPHAGRWSGETGSGTPYPAGVTAPAFEVEVGNHPIWGTYSHFAFRSPCSQCPEMGALAN